VEVISFNSFKDCGNLYLKVPENTWNALTDHTILINKNMLGFMGIPAG
jgi:hypothetical protein